MDPGSEWHQGGYYHMGHSNWSIWSLRNLSLKSDFPLYLHATCSSCKTACSEMVILIVDPGIEWHQGGMTMGNSNWSIGSPRNLFLKSKFPLYRHAICCTSISVHAEKLESYIMVPENEWHHGGWQFNSIKKGPENLGPFFGPFFGCTFCPIESVLKYP